MRINNKVFLLTVAVVISAFFGACASKKSVMADSSSYSPTDTRTAIISDALGLYKDWSSARISGKLHLESLPVSPSLKIYMKKGSALSISASAVLVGEVFRLDLTKDSLLIVNKLKKTYCRESADRLKDIYPTACEEIQSILLGRMIVPGSGELSPANIAKTTIEMENDIRKVSPSMGEFPISIAFYYLLDNVGRVSRLVIEGENGKNLTSLNYDWKGNGGVEISTIFKKRGKNIDVELDLDSPKWGGAPLEPCRIGKGYRRVSLQDFFKSI